MIEQAKHSTSSYVMPTRKKLGDAIVDSVHKEEFKDVTTLLERHRETGFTLTTDGLTYQKRCHINFVAVHPATGPIILKVIDCTEHMQEDGTKDAE